MALVCPGRADVHPRSPRSGRASRLVSGPEATARTIISRRVPGARREEILEQLEEEAAYDPRTRFWYSGAQGATGVFLTDACTHFPDQTIVVTAAVALQAKDGADAGVVSVAITLTDLAEMLTRLRVAGRPIRGFGIHTDRVIVGNFGAAERFDEALRLRPDDTAAAILRERAVAYAASPPPASAATTSWSRSDRRVPTGSDTARDSKTFLFLPHQELWLTLGGVAFTH